MIIRPPLFVVERDRPSLLGRNWLSEMKLNWHKIFWLHNVSLNQVVEKQSCVRATIEKYANGLN